ncbi:MAG: hypothetical protein IH936_01805 [Acidobacteria bacterium]|nr:hypothetical protein [Acidobacteriota bacterium]
MLIVAAIGMMVFYAQDYEMDPELVQRENDFRAELRKLQLEEARYRSALAEDKNAQVLARSLFLNQLLVRKGISWTRTFADLEEIFPPRVRMIQVRPELDAENKVLLEMIVGAETRPDFIELLIALEKSSAFGNPDVRGSSPPTDTSTTAGTTTPSRMSMRSAASFPHWSGSSSSRTRAGRMRGLSALP